MNKWRWIKVCYQDVSKKRLWRFHIEGTMEKKWRTSQRHRKCPYLLYFGANFAPETLNRRRILCSFRWCFWIFCAMRNKINSAVQACIERRSVVTQGVAWENGTVIRASCAWMKMARNHSVNTLSYRAELKLLSKYVCTWEIIEMRGCLVHFEQWK